MKAHLGNQPVQVLDRSKNLFDEEKLVEVGAVKLSSGEYYFKYASTPFQKHIWDNTENYQGQLTIALDISYISPSSTEKGVTFKFNYTDGTVSGFSGNVAVNSGYQKMIMTSTSNKIVSYIDCSYGTATTQTYIKNFQLEYGTTATEYEPYIRRFNFHSPVNLIKMPYADGLSKTQNGITFTVDEETGWVTVNGTATAIADFNFVKQFTLTIPAHSIIKGCPNGGGGLTYEIQIFRNSDSAGTPHKTFRSTGENNNEVNTFGEFVAQYARIRIRAGVTVNNLVFKPELIKLLGD